MVYLFLPRLSFVVVAGGILRPHGSAALEGGEVGNVRRQGRQARVPVSPEGASRRTVCEGSCSCRRLPMVVSYLVAVLRSRFLFREAPDTPFVVFCAGCQTQEEMNLLEQVSWVDHTRAGCVCRVARPFLADSGQCEADFFRGSLDFNSCRRPLLNKRMAGHA